MRSAKREAFCHEYLIDTNGTQAAIRAKYAKKGAGTEAGRLLQNAEVRARIRYLNGERMRRTRVDADRVLTELGAVAFAQITDLVSWRDGKLTLLDSDLVANPGAIAEIRQTREGLVVKMHSKNDAIRQLVPHVGIATETPQERADAIREALGEFHALTLWDEDDEDEAA